MKIKLWKPREVTNNSLDRHHQCQIQIQKHFVCLLHPKYKLFCFFYVYIEKKHLENYLIHFFGFHFFFSKNQKLTWAARRLRSIAEIATSTCWASSSPKFLSCLRNNFSNAEQNKRKISPGNRVALALVAVT